MRCLFSPTDAAAVEEEDLSATISPRDPASPSQSAVKAGTYVIIGVIVAVLIFIALVIDVSCYFVNKRGKYNTFFFFFCLVPAPLVNHYTVVWTNSSPTGMWRHFCYVVTTVVTTTTTTIPLCVSTVESCRLIFRCCFSSSELHVITGPDIINFRLWVRSTFSPYFHFYGARYNKKGKKCRRVQGILSSSNKETTAEFVGFSIIYFFFVCEVVLECPHHSQNESTRSTQ